MHNEALEVHGNIFAYTAGLDQCVAHRRAPKPTGEEACDVERAQDVVAVTAAHA